MSIYTAKSIILDFGQGYGTDKVGIRCLEMFLNNELITVSSANITCYATSIQDSRFPPANAFDTSKSRIDQDITGSWCSASCGGTDQRLICIFATEQYFDSIEINNFHSYGGLLERCAKNLKIYISSDSINNVSYGSEISNSLKIFVGQLRQHVASNIIDPEILSLITLSYLSGTVKTSSGEAIESATVKAIDSNDVIQGTTTTNSSGEFIIENIPSGTYSILAEKSTYKSDISNGHIALEMY